MSHDTDTERIRDWCQSIANKDVNRFVELLRDELFTDHEIARIIECMENCFNHCYDAPNTRAHHCTLKKIDLGMDVPIEEILGCDHQFEEIKFEGDRGEICVEYICSKCGYKK